MDEGRPPSESMDQSLAQLQEMARLLREAKHLSPQSQAALADLIEDLGKEINESSLPAADKERLMERVAEVAHSIHGHSEPGFLEKVREELHDLALRTEEAAPVATDVLRGLIETLASLGI